jgi:hypothetical protein
LFIVSIAILKPERSESRGGVLLIASSGLRRNKALNLKLSDCCTHNSIICWIIAGVIYWLEKRGRKIKIWLCKKGYRSEGVGMLVILQIRVATVFLLEPDIPILLSKLMGKGYVTARVRPTLEGAIISFIEPPSVIAGKGAIRVDYDFNRKVLGIESPNSKEILSALDEVESCLKEMDVNLDKALGPYEVIIIAEALLKPRFTDNKYTFKDLLGFDLRLMEGGLVSEGEPTSNRWFHMKITPIWSSYKTNGKEILYRVTIVYREEKSKLINFIQNVENILMKLLGEV